MTGAVPFFESDMVTIWNADARTAAGLLEPGSIDALVTSPPYFGLRDYGVDGQIGLEPSPDEYVDGLADLLTSYVDVLKPGGSLWLNLGDTYAASRTYQVGQTKYGNDAQSAPGMNVPDGWQAKCLLMIPERVALALICRGWILRNRVVWAKPNGMPSSARDRLATKHEALFHFVRAQRYYYDLDAIRERATSIDEDGNHVWSRTPLPPPPHHEDGVRYSSPDGKNPEKGRAGLRSMSTSPWKNPGDVWTIPTQPYPEAHFAVFPPELVRRPILATVPERVCRGCGTPRERIVERGEAEQHKRPDRGHPNSDRPYGSDRGGGTLSVIPRTTVGWSNCGCDAGWTPGTVLDPFLGSGTTAHMARRLGRKTVGIELSPDYCRLAADRFAQPVLNLDTGQGLG